MSELTSNFQGLVKAIIFVIIVLGIAVILMSVITYTTTHNKEIVSTKRLEPRIKLIVDDSNKIDTLYIYK